MAVCARGHTRQITIVFSDFSEAFISGTRAYLPNSDPVFDPFHLIQLGNRKLDKDR